MAASPMSVDVLRLDGRRALVTGASRGIGRAVAEALAMAGASVALNYARSAAEVEDVAHAIRGLGVEALVVQADVGDSGAVLRMFDALWNAWGGIDILVNNAAVIHDGFVMLMSDEAWDHVVRINLRGAFLCARQALRPMIRSRWGRIVNVISPAALVGRDGAANYAAAKGGMLSFTKSLAREVGRYGITVNALCPGLIETRMIATLPTEQRRRFEEQIALRRFGEPEEVAHAVRFLASAAAQYITGATLVVDGGLMMR